MTDLIDRMLIDRSGESVGRVVDVIADPVDLVPEWLVVKLGPIAGDHLVPVAAVDDRADGLVGAFAKGDVKSAPKVKEHIAPGSLEREALYRHYGLTAPPDHGLANHGD